MQIYLYLISIILFISAIQLFTNYIETFNNKINHIVLLGDSIFQNKQYVPDNKSIEDLLKQKSTPSSVYAEDNATISDLLSQYKQLPDNLDNSNTALLISIGGNDLLNAYTNDKVNDYTKFYAIWYQYKYTILHLLDTTKCTVILTDIYYVTDPQYTRFNPIIKKWNHSLKQFANDENLNMFHISKILTKPNDFTNGIEPSISGSEKIVNSLQT